MQIKILGSGAWEGIPAPFCDCRVCKSSDSKDNRTRPEILVETEKGKFLIEISPDIRIQSTKHNLPLIENFLISHWHFDHLYGLLELHAWSEFVSKPKLYCSKITKEWLDQNFAHIPKETVVLKPFKQFELSGVKITPIPIYHITWQDKGIKENELQNSFAFILESNSQKIVYLADYNKLPKRSLKLVKNADIVIADGTYLFEENFPKKFSGLKSDPDHLHGKKILDFVNSLKAKKVIFHSIAHLTEKKHYELQKMLPKKMFISYDGMEI
jgi:phosphoribosyl 1,2-cyclic phosphate phosphodiesterase